jgi:general stress protein 26
MPVFKPDALSADLQRKVQQLLVEQCLGVLATKDRDGHPYASLIAYAGNTDHTELYFVTPKATRKFDNLSSDPRAALLINNSINRPADFHEAMAVTVLGNTRLLENGQRSSILPIYLKRHPYLRQFAQSPSCAVFALEVTGFTMVQKFQNVSELKLDHDLDTNS